MQKTVCKVLYDTETATFIGKVTFGNYGDASGYEECLFVTPKGNYFIYVNGGPESIYKKEDIKRISKANAEAWIKEHN